MVKLSDIAPDFTLEDQRGENVTLSAFRGDKNVVLFFYPKDDTPICTKEACQFRDEYPAFEAKNAVILGISGDNAASHANFAARHNLPYPVLCDPSHEVARRYGAMMAFGLMADRVTYVIDRQGLVVHITQARLSADRHVQEAREALRRL